MFRIRFVFMLLVSLSVLFEIPVFADSNIQISAFTDTPDPALKGGEINYSITVVNGGIDSATNSSLTFPLPETTEFVSATTPECAHDNGTPGTVTCSFGTINGTTSPGNPTDPRTVVITLRTTPSTPNSISVTATVSADNDNTPENNTSTQNTTINNGADVQIEKSDSPDPVYGGEILTYTLSVKNNGPNDAAIVTVTDTLPPDVTYQSYSGSGWSCSHSSGIVTCSRNNLSSGVTADNITITTRVTGANSGDVSNTGAVSAQSAPNINMDPVLSNNIDSEITQLLPGTDLSITKVTVGSVIAGDNVTFELRPRNNGPITAVNASISDTLPADFTFVSATGAGWSCSHYGSPTGGTITCTRGSFPVGDTNNITVIVTAPSSGGGTSNTATITSDTTDPNPGNNSSTVNFVVVPDGADLSLTKSKSPNPVALGSNITSNFTVHNNGPRDTSGTVTLVDNLSSIERYVSYSGTGWYCSESSGIVTCTYDHKIPAGADAPPLTITTKATEAGVITNNASVSDVGGQDDNISSNNTSSASVTSTSRVADLFVKKEATTTNGDAVLDDNEDNLTYTITVTNLDNILAPQGTTLDNATNVTFTDVIPARYSGTAGTTGINVSYSPLSAGFSCSVSGGNVTCAGGTVNLGESVIFTITVSRPLIDGEDFTNTASAYSQDVGDPDRTNNAGSVDVTIRPVADVTVTGKTVLPNPVKEGVNATYTISIRNNGPSTANNVVVTDVFDPADTNFVFISKSATEGSCNYDSSSYTLTCNGITLSNNESRSVSLTIRPNYTSDNPSRSIKNTAKITTTTKESNYNNNEDNATLNVEASELDILVNKVESSTLYDPIGFDPTDRTNNIIIYRVDITNQGPSLATGITLTDLMTPKNGKTLKFLCDQVNATDNCDNNTSQNAKYCDHQGDNVTGPGNLSITCNIPDNLSANQSLSHYLLFEVITAPDPSGDTHFNLASVSPNEVDRNVANDNESEGTTVLKRVDLSLSKTPNDNQVSILQPFNWTIVVTNNGPGNSDNTTVTDTVPNGLEILSTPLWTTTNGTPSNGTCSVVGQSITCNFGMLEANKTATITVPVRAVQYPLSGSVTNCATATTDQVDPISGNNTTICSTVNVVKSDIKGYVYEDLNNNGIQDGSEIGIENVTVRLSGTDLYGNNVNIVTQTDSNGNFVFDNLSPSDGNGYTITETHPVSYFDGIDNVTGGISGVIGNDIFTEVNLEENQSLSHYTFGEIPKSSISGNVWHDVNNDGIFDNFESGIAGVTITLTGIDWFNQPVSRTTTTGADGSYSFGDLWPSDNYTVTETQPSGWIDGKDSVGNSSGTLENDVISSIVLHPKTNYTELNFGELLAGAISGFVYIDLDNDAFKDDNETTMLGGIEIILTGTNDLGASVYYQTTTDSNGIYIFTGLRPGNYKVTETKPALPATGSQVGSLGGNPGSDQTTQFTNSIILSSDNSGINYNFGHLGGSVEVTIYDDKDKDGLFDPNVDIPLSGVSVKVTDSAGNEYTIVTDDNGFASQLVPPGQTIVDVDGSTLSPFYKLTIDDHGHGNDPTTVDVPLGGVGKDFNGYIYLPPVAVPLMGDFTKYIFALLLFFSSLIFLRKKL